MEHNFPASEVRPLIAERLLGLSHMNLLDGQLITVAEVGLDPLALTPGFNMHILQCFGSRDYRSQ